MRIIIAGLAGVAVHGIRMSAMEPEEGQLALSQHTLA